MASNSPTFELGFLDDFDDLENVSEMVAETTEARRRSTKRKSATLENNAGGTPRKNGWGMRQTPQNPYPI